MPIQNKIIKLIIEKLSIPKKFKKLINDNHNLSEDLGADSLSLNELHLALEEKFDIEIPEQDWFKLKTIGDINNYIFSKC